MTRKVNPKQMINLSRKGSCAVEGLVSLEVVT